MEHHWFLSHSIVRPCSKKCFIVEKGRQVCRQVCFHAHVKTFTHGDTSAHPLFAFHCFQIFKGPWTWIYLVVWRLKTRCAQMRSAPTADCLIILPTYRLITRHRQQLWRALSLWAPHYLTCLGLPTAHWNFDGGITASFVPPHSHSLLKQRQNGQEKSRRTDGAGRDISLIYRSASMWINIGEDVIREHW